MATTTEFKKSRRIREITTTLVFGDTTSALMFILPRGARIILWIMNVKTLFAGGTTTMDVGTSSDPDVYVDGTSLAAVGQVVPSTTVVSPGPETTDQTGIYMNVGAGNTTGEVDVVCLFSLDVDRRI